MSEVERRRQYTETRVLIDSAKILSPTFDDGDLYFTGSQIELMRNLMQYANRIESYVAEYEPGYYLTPDNDDWDDIQAIVADLEEVLMGNPNTLWGYAGIWSEVITDDNADAGVNLLQGAVCPAGYVYVLQAVFIRNLNSEAGFSFIQVYTGTSGVWLAHVDPLLVGIPLLWSGEVVIPPAGSVQAYMLDCTAGDDISLTYTGYKMAIPT